jgi:1-deoxy-D-xylulose-5-phosphate reductoisomerase
MDFFKVDTTNFRCLDIAYQALSQGGNQQAIVNAANEIAVQAFANGFIRFLDIPDVILDALVNIKLIQKPSLFDIIQTNVETRNYVTRTVTEHKIWV